MRFTFQLSAALMVAGLHTLVHCHMEMTFPPPLRSKANPFAAGDVDFDMTSPLSASGSNFPCKGYLNLLGTDAAKPVATFAGGQTYNMTIQGGAAHEGGSCQASLSYDNGKTFSVIKSIVGGCPLSGTSSFDFTVPADVPTADDAVFAWTWFNKVGNREMYMNCAVVSTQGGGGASKRQTSTAFSSRPEILVANVGNGCSTAEGTDVKFSNPGPDVTEESSNTSPPEGNCGGGGGGGNGGGNSNEGGNNGAPPSDGSPSTPTNVLTTSTPAPTAADPVVEPPTNTLPGGVFIPTRSEGVPVPTSTLLTVTSTSVPSVRPSVTSVGGEVGLSSTAPPAAPTQSVPGNDNAGAGAQAPGAPCANEGEWNCIAGKQFQRCASGAWSNVIAMATGTTCESGLSQTLVWVKRRGGARRMVMH